MRDTTGAVLPGVTVEAASPALIEKVKSAVTDEQGQYKILDLRPGAYTRDVHADGVPHGQARRGRADDRLHGRRSTPSCKIGSLEETITVTGASPIVDTQNVRNQNVLSREVLETRARRAYDPGLCGADARRQHSRRPSRTSAATGASRSPASAIHGNRSTDSARTMDGMGINTMLGTRRRRQLLLQDQRRDGAGGHHHDRRPVGGVRDGRPRDEHRAEGRGQPVRALLERLVLQQGPAEQQLLRRAASPKSAGAAQRRGRSTITASAWAGLSSTTSCGSTPGIAHGARSRSRPSLYFNTHPGHAVLHAGSEPTGVSRQLGARPQRPRHLANQQQEQAQLLPVVPAELHLLADRDGGRRVGYAPDASTEFHYDPIVMPQVTWSYAASNRLLFEAGGTYLHQTIDSTPTPESDAGRAQRDRADDRHRLQRSIDNEDDSALTALQAYGGPEPEQPRENARSRCRTSPGRTL